MKPARASVAMPECGARIRSVTARAYRIPTEKMEADGTLDWDHTTLILVHIEAGGKTGSGYSYVSRAAQVVIEDILAPAIENMDAFDIPRCWQAMRVAVRNSGQSGIAACAISAVDAALWDVKAKLLDVSLSGLLGKRRDRITAYGSGGFTTMNADAIAKQIAAWTKLGLRHYKIKIGRDQAEDDLRIAAAHQAMPEDGKLFVDANGAYTPKQALAKAQRMVSQNVAWFEEPVSSDDIAGLCYVREHAPAEMEIAAGEYSFSIDDARRLLEAQAVDVLQADATRCLGITGFLQQAALAGAHHRPLSAHCAPGLHAALMCHAETGVHCEYFTDHVRIETMMFDGMPTLRDGCLIPNDAPGLGFTFKFRDAEKFAL